MIKMEKDFQNALEEFEKGNFRTSLLSLIGIYKKGYRRNDIISFMNEVCYFPNEQEMRDNFNKNIDLLVKYPFIVGLERISYDELSFLLYMISETEFYIFDKHQKNFIYLYDCGQKDEYYNCLKHFDSIRVFNNETDFSKICYMNRNIRKSEDLGRENHIYLNYDSIDVLYPLMIINDFSNIICDGKFVIAIGEENNIEPSNFENVFNISYDKFKLKELNISDINRIFFGWKMANDSGTSFLADIMDFHPSLLTIPDCMFNEFYLFYFNELKGKTVKKAIFDLKKLSNSDKKKQFIIRIVNPSYDKITDELKKELNCISANKFLDLLCSEFDKDYIPTPKDWVAAIYLTYSKCHNRDFNERVIPAIFMYPHDDMFYLSNFNREWVNFYLDVVCSFNDFKAIATIRNPITRSGSIIRFMTEGHPQAKDSAGGCVFDPFYCMAFGELLLKDYYFIKEHIIWENTRIIRFEDLKLNPEATLESLTEFLDISINEILFKTTWLGYDKKGETSGKELFSGFDITPVYRSYPNYFTVFDKFRIEYVMYPIMKFYGYEPIYYDGQEFSKEDFNKMFEIPFLFESIEINMTKENREYSRDMGVSFINSALQIRNYPFHIEGIKGTFMPIQMLEPNKDLLKTALFKNVEENS